MKALNVQTAFNNSLFPPGYSHYVDSRALYMWHFNAIPSVCLINQIDKETAFEAFLEKYRKSVTDLYEYKQIDNSETAMRFNENVVVLKNNCILVFNTQFCTILHPNKSQEFVNEVATYLSALKQKPKKVFQMNLIVSYNGYLDLKAVEIKRLTVDLDLFYEDDFKQIDETVRKRLNHKNDKGIVLLHGLPGTGKTTYLRYLIAKINKPVLFLPPHMAQSLVDPGFADIIIRNPNTVLVIEDAEDIIMERKGSNNAAVSTLLNLSDGLLSDGLNVQVICTFNCSLPTIDKALLRKGRLIARYEFGKLTIPKAQRLSNKFGFKTQIDRPMTVAEIINQHEKNYSAEESERMGFRKN